MRPTQLVLVGGFLGAGKTTLLAQAARRLRTRNQRVGFVTNDQAEQLVDTGLLRQAGLPVAEVAGGCFCCRFDQLMAAFDRLLERDAPDVLFGEPVGSCTDLSATVLQPLKRFHADRLRTAPFSVLVDPARLEEALRSAAAPSPDAPPLPDNVLYIFRKQLEEADAIVLNKIDLYDAPRLAALEAELEVRLPGRTVFRLSSLTGAGVDAWLDWVLQARPAGGWIAEVDYDMYADGEAVLGWLNATVRLCAARETDWPAFCLRFLAEARAAFQRRAAEIAHFKLLLTAASGAGAGVGGALAANLTGVAAAPALRGAVSALVREAELIVNARAHATPEVLRAVVEHALRTAANETIQFEITGLRNFSPARPQPTHRFAAVV